MIPLPWTQINQLKQTLSLRFQSSERTLHLTRVWSGSQGHLNSEILCSSDRAYEGKQGWDLLQLWHSRGKAGVRPSAAVTEPTEGKQVGSQNARSYLCPVLGTKGVPVSFLKNHLSPFLFQNPNPFFSLYSLLIPSTLVADCLNYFSITVVKLHDQSSL